MAVSSHDLRDVVEKHAERRMRQWSVGQGVEEAVSRERAAGALAEEIQPYVAISREAGAGGGEIARLVAERLGWRLLDRELLHDVAQSHHWTASSLEFVDERTANWIFEIFGKWLDERSITQTEYVVQLGRTLLLETRRSRSVIVGRGAQFLLPSEKGLTVRIVAPLKFRVARMAQLLGTDRDTARQYVLRTERDRSEFIQRYFHHDPGDPHLYDLVLNRERFDAEQAARLIADLCRGRFGEG